MKMSAWQFWIDRGGTFTDIVGKRPDGSLVKFDANADALKLPANMYFGEVTGVAVNAQKHVFVFNRTGERSTVHGATASQLWEFGPDGAFIREIGKDLYGFAFAHTVQVDKQGNIWTSDEGTNMVVKFSPAGKVLMVLGRRAEAVDVAQANHAFDLACDKTQAMKVQINFGAEAASV